jgi:hypothetical protein
MTKNANQPQTVSTPGNTLAVTNYTMPVSMKSNLFYKRSSNNGKKRGRLVLKTRPSLP